MSRQELDAASVQVNDAFDRTIRVLVCAQYTPSARSGSLCKGRGAPKEMGGSCGNCERCSWDAEKRDLIAYYLYLVENTHKATEQLAEIMSLAKKG